MLMADMSEGERETLRNMNDYRIPEGAELLELCPVLWHGGRDVALLRHANGRHDCVLLDSMWMPSGISAVEVLRERLQKYEHAIRDTRRFLEIADLVEGITQLDRGEGVDLEEVLKKAEKFVSAAKTQHGWTCPSCGTAFQEEQPVCPACGV